MQLALQYNMRVGTGGAKGPNTQTRAARAAKKHSQRNPSKLFQDLLTLYQVCRKSHILYLVCRRSGILFTSLWKQFRELETFIISFQLCHNSDAAGGRMRIMEQGRRWKNYSLVELSNCGRFRGKKCFSISDGLFSVRWVMGYKHQIGCFPYVLPFFLHIYDSFKSI